LVPECLFVGVSRPLYSDRSPSSIQSVGSGVAKWMEGRARERRGGRPEGTSLSFPFVDLDGTVTLGAALRDFFRGCSVEVRSLLLLRETAAAGVWPGLFDVCARVPLPPWTLGVIDPNDRHPRVDCRHNHHQTQEKARRGRSKPSGQIR
jgi:hypothetical protein